MPWPCFVAVEEQVGKGRGETAETPALAGTVSINRTVQ